jgi:uncharacterized protein DUF3105
MAKQRQKRQQARLTKRERKVEAKQRRLEELKRRARRKRMRKVYGGGAAAVVVVVIIVVAALAGGRGKADRVRLNELAAKAGCDRLQSPTIEGSQHVSSPARVAYKTNPPTSGDHYPSPTSTGTYNSPIQDEILVHNLEHGHVEFLWKPGEVSQEIVTALQGIVRSDRSFSLVAPRPTNNVPLAFTAWGQLLKCPRPASATAVVAAARQFKKMFRDHGREHIPGTNPVFAPPSPVPPVVPTATDRPRATPS